MPDTTTDPMAMFEVFDPARASLEFVLGNPEDLSDIPGLIADQRVGKRDVLRDRSRRQPVNELALDLRELRRSEFGRTSVLSNSGVDTTREVPMLSNLELFLSWNVHPLLFVLQDFAYRAPLHTVFDRNVFLSSGGILLMIQADLLAVDVEETLLFVFSDHWCRVHLGLTVRRPGGRGDGCKGGRHAQGRRGGSGVRI